jgi:ribosome recycling factor
MISQEENLYSLSLIDDKCCVSVRFCVTLILKRALKILQLKIKMHFIARSSSRQLIRRSIPSATTRACVFATTTTNRFNTASSIQQQQVFDQQQYRHYAKANNKKKVEVDESEEVDAKFDKKDVESKMDKPLQIFKLDLNQVRTGRANPNMIENIKVKLESGETVLLKTLGSIVVKNARLLTINVFDQKNTNLIVRAIVQEELGFNPQAKQNVIDVPVPKMTLEIRDNIVKMIKRNAESTKEKIRNVRRDGMNVIKKMKHLPKDDVFKLEKEMQTLTDDYIKKVDDLEKAKEKEILSSAQL